MRKAQGELDFYRRLDADEESLCQLKDITKTQVTKYKKHGFDIKCYKDGSFSYKRNSERIDKLAEQLGYFCILSSDLNMDSETVLLYYRKKDAIEKAFNEMKNHLDMSRLRTHNQATLEGKMFCAFIALIVRMYIERKLSKWMKKNRMTFERNKRGMIKIQ